MRIILLSAAALLTAAPALAQEPTRFSYAGVQYEYVAKDLDDGSRVITGRNLTSRQPFKLTVRGRRVAGMVGGASVSFKVPRTAEATTELASK